MGVCEQAIAPEDDPLGVLRSARWVMERAESVRIDAAAVEAVARRIAAEEITAPEWDAGIHWSGDPEATANYVLVLDALNFSFWGEPRWTVVYGGRRCNGYWALVAALTQALDTGVPLTDAAFLAQLDTRRLGEILDGQGPVPMLAERAANLREAGHVLLERFDGHFSGAILAAKESAVRLVELVVANFPSFRDVARYRGAEVRFYKRAQILAGDLYGAFGGQGLGRFQDMGKLTAFADYKVPQVLEGLGVLVYRPALAGKLDARQELAPGSPEEVEIRAATIWAVEELRRALARRGRPPAPFQIDWALWSFGQDLAADVRPYHRTRTIFY